MQVLSELCGICESELDVLFLWWNREGDWPPFFQCLYSCEVILQRSSQSHREQNSPQTASKTPSGGNQFTVEQWQKGFLP